MHVPEMHVQDQTDWYAITEEKQTQPRHSHLEDTVETKISSYRIN